AAESEGANIPSGEEERLHHKGIGGERKTRAVDVENRLIVKAIERGVVEGRQEEFANEFGAKRSAAPVAEQHGVFRGKRRRAREVRNCLYGHNSVLKLRVHGGGSGN